MTEAKRERLIKRAQARYERTVREAKALLDSQLLSITVVYDMENCEDRTHDAPVKRRSTELTKQIQEAVAGCAGRFTVLDVVNRLKHLNGALNRNSVGNLLERLAKDKSVLIVAERGSGRRATVYQRVENGVSHVLQTQGQT